MKRKIFGNKGGFTLVEVVTAMAVLAIIAAPVGGALVVSWRMNAYADRVLEARLDVSTAAETLMAEGIDSTITDDLKEHYEDRFDNLTFKIEPEDDSLIYDVTITSSAMPSVHVATKIRAAGVGDGAEGG